MPAHTWTPPKTTLKLTTPVAANLRKLVQNNYPLALRMKFALELDGESAETSLSAAERQKLRKDAIELYRYLPLGMVPLATAQQWVNEGAWDVAPPQLDDDDRTTWATFADRDALIAALDQLAPTKQAKLAPLPNLSLGVPPIKLQQNQPTFHAEVLALAKLVDELSLLPPDKFEARKWEALFLVGSLFNASTPAAQAQAKADLKARWETTWKQEGGLGNLLAPELNAKWWFKTSDGKPPALQPLLESALVNPSRSPASRVQLLQSIPKERRPEFEPLARLVYSDLANNAGPYNMDFIVALKAIVKQRFNHDDVAKVSPWVYYDPYNGQPAPMEILVKNQVGYSEQDVGQSEWEKKRLEEIPFWKNAIADWNVTWLRDNPLSAFYLGVAEGAGKVVKGVDDFIESSANTLGYIPYIALGLAILGGGIFVARLASK